ncbi:nucleoside deaminase [Actinokineospora bangkokensis]|uniref:tRNA-specific adenosine deaminase n=1 Tax=Actinokineospora bangkokensis TaxID=1193682 RepID=A0A1Q9LHB8_9PSEU|nr:nucleoside deaminase [Actinokineospora bangkokensis]OLR91447.1 tRNA-specific adenosine deaminase [Actinokineospora bangkokensis]
MRPGDVDLVRAALAAAAGSGPDVPIGAVVFDPDGRELARAHNAREALGDPTAHAEVLALRAAAARRGDGWRLTGCTLAVTLEPCTMCAGALVLARVSRVVFGAWEPKTGAAGSLWDVVRDRRLAHRPEVVGGVLERECAALLEGFFGDRRNS